MIIRYGMLAVLVYTTTSRAEEISISYSLISGTKYSEKSAIYPSVSSYGVFNSSITPGGRSFHSITIRNGLIYSFNGQDVWAFDTADRKWAWMAGLSDSRAASYGVKGIASASTTPGYRILFGGDIYRDRDVYLLYGGGDGTSDFYSDVWTFSFASLTWKWLAGSSDAGKAPEFSTNNPTPGGRAGMGAAILPSTGEFLFFGGVIPGDGQIAMADMWSFNYDTLNWTWISGSSLPGAAGSSNGIGRWSAKNYPRSRSLTSLVLNSDSDILYLFGGLVTGFRNDLWAFKRDTLQWAHISGSGSTNGYCGTMGSPNVNNTIGSRMSNTMFYHSQSHLIIVFGGNGNSCGSSRSFLSDTWAFDPETKEWAWIAGSTDGSDLYPNNYDKPSALTNSAAAVDPVDGRIYMFGGTGWLRENIQFGADIVWSSNINTSRPNIYSVKQPDYTIRSSETISISSDSISTSTTLMVVTNDKLPHSVGFFGSLTSFAVYLILGAIFVLALIIYAVAGMCIRNRRQKGLASISSTNLISEFDTNFSTTSETIKSIN